MSCVLCDARTEGCIRCGSVRITLDADEVRLLREALDSHAYWQVSDESYRNNGFVHEPGSDDEDNVAELKAIDALLVKLGDEPCTFTKEEAP